LFGHLVGGGKQGRRHLDAERLGGLEIDHELEAGRLLNRPIARRFTAEHPVDTGGSLRQP
jgi:hypothetical protein